MGSLEGNANSGNRRDVWKENSIALSIKGFNDDFARAIDRRFTDGDESSLPELVLYDDSPAALPDVLGEAVEGVSLSLEVFRDDIVAALGLLEQSLLNLFQLY